MIKTENFHFESWKLWLVIISSHKKISFSGKYFKIYLNETESIFKLKRTH